MMFEKKLPAAMILSVLCSISAAKAVAQDQCDPFETTKADLLEDAFDVKAIDIDDDGFVDLVAVAPPNRVQVLRGLPDGTYAQSSVFETGDNPRRLHVHDFNADQHLDILVLASDTKDARVHLSDGNGNFVSQEIPANRYEYLDESIEADFDNDNDLDFAVLYSNDSIIVVYMNNGDGTFTVRYRPTHRFSRAFASADINNDGIMDLIAAGYHEDVVTVYYGSGTGGFSNITNTDIGRYSAHYFEPADFNNDQRQDVAVVTSYGVRLLFSNSHGELEYEQNIPVDVGSPAQVAAHQPAGSTAVNLIIVGEDQPGVAYYLNNGQGEFSIKQLVPLDWNPTALKLADLDQDGDDDLVVVDLFSDRAAVLQWDAMSSLFQLVSEYEVGRRPAQIDVRDMDNDGRQDVVIHNISGHDVSILRNNGQLEFESDQFPPTLQFDVGPRLIEAIDFDLDGREDLAVFTGGPSQIHMIRRGSGAEFEILNVIELNGYPNDAAVADIDQDGFQDILCLVDYDDVQIFYGPDYLNTQSLQAADFAYGFTLIDINSDGLDDVFTNSERVYINNGNREFVPVALDLYEGITQTDSAVTLDADADGDQDLVLSLGSSPQRNRGGSSYDLGVYLYLNNDGVISVDDRIQIGDPDDEITAHSAIDANLDGITDLIVGSRLKRESSLYLGNPDATFTQTPLAPYHNVLPTRIADVNNDGLQDILAARYWSSDVLLLLADANGEFEPPVSISTGRRPLDAIAHDADADGDADIITANSEDLNLSIISNICTDEPTQCPADMDMNGILSNQDAILFLDWYYAADPRADLNTDKALNFYDVTAFIRLYRAGCP